MIGEWRCPKDAVIRQGPCRGAAIRPWHFKVEEQEVGRETHCIDEIAFAGEIYEPANTSLKSKTCHYRQAQARFIFLKEASRKACARKVLVGLVGPHFSKTQRRLTTHRSDDDACEGFQDLDVIAQSP